MKFVLFVFISFGLISTQAIADDSARGLKLILPAVPSINNELDQLMSEEPVEILLPEVNMNGSTDSTLSSLTKIYVKQINLNGNTLFRPADLDHIVKPYLNRYVSIDELHQLRHQLSRAYITKGYINSGVVLPDQKISDGLIHFNVIEGRLTDIKILGNDKLNTEYITDRIHSNNGQPLNILDTQNDLKLLQRNPLLSQINASLEPGNSLGESTLIVNVKERERSLFSITLDNHKPPSVGSERIGINYENSNLTGGGDALFLSAGTTDGINDIAVTYSNSLTHHDDKLSIYFSNNESIVIEEPFSAIDLESESMLIGILYGYPVINTLNNTQKVLVGLETNENKSTILGSPIAFDPGADSLTGESKVAVFQLGYDYLNRSIDSIFTYNIMLRHGLDIANSTINTNGLPDSKFNSLRAQFQFAKKIPLLSSQFFARSSVQFTADPLLSLEKFVIGGASSVRGYRENQYIRDNGMLLTFEWQIPVSRDARGNRTNKINIIPFIDMGYAKDSDEVISDTKSESISSAGLGFTWNPNQSFHFDVYFAHAFDEVPVTLEDNLQDDGIHFSAAYMKRF